MTAIKNEGKVPLPWKANADLSASSNRYLFVRVVSGSAENIQIGSGASNPRPCGILQNCPCSGEEAEVIHDGPSKLRTRTTTCNVGIGSRLTADASGYGILVTTTGCDPYAAIALEALTSGSAIIEVYMTPFGMGNMGSSS